MKFRDGIVKTNRRRGLSDVTMGLAPAACGCNNELNRSRVDSLLSISASSHSYSLTKIQLDMFLLILAVLLDGGLSADPVTQSPVTKTVLEGGSVRLHCEYTDPSMDSMQWYHKKAAQPPIWIISKYVAVKKDEVSGRYLAAADKSEQNGYLNISALSVDDGAVYYCAVRHSVR
ncbi:hypothetical protein scyTo_0021846 [Scyliorhinus torazame]|uniref:Ig-like domain-containing protein n=1 Tax=Scyliorhinus torazame TaxID=75743 RepID=A0A401Q7W9_SCYTO|nr:hypothetical protein [Scyliorhinus torazame]